MLFRSLLKLRDYFQLDVDFASLREQWCEAGRVAEGGGGAGAGAMRERGSSSNGTVTADDAMVEIAGLLSGMRILRQDPNECLFSFICSN